MSNEEQRIIMEFVNIININIINVIIIIIIQLFNIHKIMHPACLWVI